MRNLRQGHGDGVIMYLQHDVGDLELRPAALNTKSQQSVYACCMVCYVTIQYQFDLLVPAFVCCKHW